MPGRSETEQLGHGSKVQGMSCGGRHRLSSASSEQGTLQKQGTSNELCYENFEEKVLLGRSDVAKVTIEWTTCSRS